MDERSTPREVISEVELSRLRQEFETAEAELTEIEKEHSGAINDLAAGKKDAARNFNNYLIRSKQAKQKAFTALEAWGNAAAKFYKLED